VYLPPAAERLNNQLAEKLVASQDKEGEVAKKAQGGEE
jgi:hypothetical protein